MIVLPPFLTAMNAGAVLHLCRALKSAGEPVVHVDASALRMVDPFGMCLLAATCQHLEALDIRLELHGLNQEVGGWLARMDFFQQCPAITGLPAVPQRRWNRADALMELCRIDDAAEVDRLARVLAQALVGRVPGIDPNEAPDEMTGLTMQDRFTDPLQYVLSETLENALTHGRRNGYGHARVWVASQYYPSKDVVRLGLVDNGCGFLASLRNHPQLPLPTHAAAIQTALIPRVSCNRDVGLMGDSINQGVGLTVTKEIVRAALGRMTLVSGDSLMRLHPRTSLPAEAVDYWQGVGVAIEMRRSALLNVRVRVIVAGLPGFSPVSGIRFE